MTYSAQEGHPEQRIMWSQILPKLRHSGLETRSLIPIETVKKGFGPEVWKFRTEMLKIKAFILAVFYPKLKEEP